MGKISVPVKYSSNDEKVLDLVVIQGKHPALFGRDWLSQIRLDWESIFKVTEHVRNRCSVPVPYSLVSQVEKEYDKLVEVDILYPVSHSSWASPVVHVPKADGPIRVCGDYKALKVNGLTITNPLELSNEFNNHFANIGPKLASEINCDSGSYQRYLTVTDKRFKLQPTNSNKVFSLLNKLDKSKATSLDKISARFVRECADLICVPICDIFNESISQGIFPDDWKYARVTPLYKQGDRGDVNNYRPISVIKIVAKVFQRIVYEQLYAYLEEHDVLCQNQSGFRANHSTVTALLEATDSWAYNIDNRKINGVIFLDF